MVLLLMGCTVLPEAHLVSLVHQRVVVVCHLEALDFAGSSAGRSLKQAAQQKMVVNTFVINGRVSNSSAASANLYTFGLVADAFSEVQTSLHVLHCIAGSVGTTPAGCDVGQWQGWFASFTMRIGINGSQVVIEPLTGGGFQLSFSCGLYFLFSGTRPAVAPASASVVAIISSSAQDLWLPEGSC